MGVLSRFVSSYYYTVSYDPRCRGPILRAVECPFQIVWGQTYWWGWISVPRTSVQLEGWAGMQKFLPLLPYPTPSQHGGISYHRSWCFLWQTAILVRKTTLPGGLAKREVLWRTLHGWLVYPQRMQFEVREFWSLQRYLLYPKTCSLVRISTSGSPMWRLRCHLIYLLSNKITTLTKLHTSFRFQVQKSTEVLNMKEHRILSLLEGVSDLSGAT